MIQPISVDITIITTENRKELTEISELLSVPTESSHLQHIRPNFQEVIGQSAHKTAQDHEIRSPCKSHPKGEQHAYSACQQHSDIRTAGKNTAIFLRLLPHRVPS